MNRTLVTALVTGSAIVGAGYFLSRRQPPRALPSSIIPIITPVIDVGVAEDVLEAMEHLPGDEVTLVLHTMGGCVTSCVLIANALRQFGKSTAVVPYMAISGGTLIALNAHHLQMGRSASLSAVDPILYGQRARHVPGDESMKALHGLALEYQQAMTRYLRETLAARLPDAGEAALEQAMGVFMGDHAPHEWPIRRPEVEALGLDVTPAARSWGAMVDTFRKRWW
jgi:pimeloyl-ACP methyl ester carboxylesterase